MEREINTQTGEAHVAQKVLIDQRDNFSGHFGHVLRSSAIFYYRKDKNFSTTISLFNYWKHKREIPVVVLASLRSMSGALLSREEIPFTIGDVVNYVPSPGSIDIFEGSIEIEVFSIQNMVIPYAAVIALYRSDQGLSMVHSYARAYSRHEVEEGRTLSHGEEACWSIRDSEGVSSFAVFHNGPRALGPQMMRLRVQKSDPRLGVLERTIELPELKPFQTVRVTPQDHFPTLCQFLAGETGFASLSFVLGESFTRMLVGHESSNGSDFQVTHSNFNYRIHQTNRLALSIDSCYMYVPYMTTEKKAVVIYPDSDPGDYSVQFDSRNWNFSSGVALEFPATEGMVLFKRPEGALPSRIVTGLVLHANNGLLPAEMSLGVLTQEQPPKRLWWGPVNGQPDTQTYCVVHDLQEIYGATSHEQDISFGLFSSQSFTKLTAKIPMSRLKELKKGLPVEDLFPNYRDFLGESPGYYTMYSEYPGLTAYSLVSRNSGSVTVEHGF